MGPLVVGVVYIDNDDALKEIGVKDSKKLTPKARDRMYDQIIDAADHWTTVVATAEMID